MYSNDYWLKASENLEMALLAHQRKKHNVCASRAYYAVFLASIAALTGLTDLRAKDNEWDHGQVQAELNRRLIMRRKVLPAELGRTPMDLMELRHLADYKPQSVSAIEAKRACNRAKRFLSSVESVLEGRL
ncbi:MAG: HEPN domain-containing protein [Pyrinomonadaceae bacterium]|nr:HEPN domain-containing protein [Pyrinomonadaceae bacterium]